MLWDFSTTAEYRLIGKFLGEKTENKLLNREKC